MRPGGRDSGDPFASLVLPPLVPDRCGRWSGRTSLEGDLRVGFLEGEVAIALDEQFELLPGRRNIEESITLAHERRNVVRGEPARNA